MRRAEAALRAIERVVLSALVVVAVASLLVLVAINRGSYDDGHVASISMIAAGHLPQAGDCDECYQPKFYYVVAGLLARAVRIDPADAVRIRVAGQVVSGAAGLVALWVGWRMLAELAISARLRRLAFALFACNATLIGMFVQSTNDAFAIACGSLAVLFAMRLARTPAGRPLDLPTVGFLTLACIAVSVSKASGIALSASVALLLLWRTATAGRSRAAWRANATAAMLFAVPYLVTVPFLGGYLQNISLVGTPSGIGMERSSPPGIFVPRYPTGPGIFKRPGVLDIVDGYLTLKPFDILERPWISDRVEELYSARTSLWTQVFARSHFIFFEQWPLQWYDTDEPVVLLGRAIFVVGWITTGLMLAGFGFAAVAVFGRRDGAAPFALWSESGVALALTAALVAALMVFNYNYRDAGAMKAMYMYPIILCAVWAFARGVGGLRARLQSSAARLRAFDLAIGTSVIAVCALYVAQLGLLISIVVRRL